MKYFPEYKATDNPIFIDLYRQGFDRYCRQLAEYYGCLNNQGLALLDEDADTEQDSAFIDDLFILPSFDSSATSAENFDNELQTQQTKKNINTAKLLATKPRQFILGDPGIGKTTFLHWLAISLAHHRSNYVQQSMGPLLPILLRVRDFRSYLTDSSDPEQFIVHLKNYLGSLGELLDLDRLTQAMTNGQVLLLVDGLDEIGKQEMLNLGRSLAGLFNQYPSIKCIMTARVVGFDASLLWPSKIQQKQQQLELNEENELNNDQKDTDLLNRKVALAQHDFSTYYIQPLNDEQRLQFSQKWCKIYVKNNDAQPQFIADLQAAFNDNGSLNNLSRTPVLLNMICFIQHRRGRLPNGRAELYQKIIETYLVSMDRARGIENDFIDSEDFDYTDIRNWLAKLAYAMQLGKLDELLNSSEYCETQIENLYFDSEIARSTSLTESELTIFFAKELEEVYEDLGKCQQTAEKLIDYIKRRTGFLIDRGQDAEQGHETVFAFSHLSFQEFFAAHFISQQWSQLSSNTELVESLTISCNDQSWFECWQLVFEDYSQNGNNRQQHAQFIDTLFGSLEELSEKLNYDMEAYWIRQDYAIHLLSKIILNPAVKLPPKYRQQQLTNLWVHSLNLEDEQGSASMLSLWPELCKDYSNSNSLSRKAIATAFDNYDQRKPFRLDLSNVKTSDLRPLALWPNISKLDLTNTQVSSLQLLENLDELCSLDCSYTQVSDLTPLTKLTKLTELTASGIIATSWTPLAKLSQLEYLRLDKANISDLSPLTKLNDLQSLSLDETDISDLSPLINLTRLKDLRIQSTSVTDLTPLSKLVQLEYFNIIDTDISDLIQIKHFTQLKQLVINKTKISDLNPIAKLKKLSILSFNETKVSDLKPIANLTALRFLSCSITEVSDLTPIIKLSQLGQLYIFDTAVSDLSPLTKLKNLRELNISFNMKISELTPLAKLPKLRRLIARNCNLLNEDSLRVLPKNIRVYL